MRTSLRTPHPAPGDTPTNYAAAARIRAAGPATMTVRQTHLVAADEGVDAPCPTEYVLAALAASQAQAYRRHAHRLGIPLKDVTIEITCTQNPSFRPGPLRIIGTVRLSGSLSRNDLTRLQAEVQRHCPLLDLIRTVTPVRLELTANDQTF